MLQDFAKTTSPEQGPPRLKALRAEIAHDGLDGFLVPRADVHQGEYVAPRDERLAWLTGFTGSAGFCAVLADKAGIFIDGRYRVQVRAQVAEDFTPVHWPETQLVNWLMEELGSGTVGYDPRLHTIQELEAIEAIAGDQIKLRAVDNLIDRIWSDQPNPPTAPAVAHPLEFAGEASGDKRRRLAEILRDTGQTSAVLTLPDSVNWLLNIRGADIARTPVMQGFAVLHDTAHVDLFCDPAKVAALGEDPDITVHPENNFWSYLEALQGVVRVDPATAPVAVFNALTCTVVRRHDPCVFPKARKNPTEIAGMRAAHDRDAIAMVEFLAWLDEQKPGTFSEIDAVKALEGFRSASNLLRDISFETISGSNAHGAIVHYRVTDETNATVDPGLLLIDSGGQYLDGTTDITRTIAIGPPTDEHRRCYTLVLQGMVAVSRARFPKGIAGRDIDSMARAPLWREGMDYDHGTGHGVGAYLSVHEGPVRISRASTHPLEAGMILSNEPGYYRDGEFGIRIENLIVVEPAETSADGRDMHSFETLTFVPFDRRLIDPDRLTPDERAWINSYHEEVARKLDGHLSDRASTWLGLAVAPI